MPRWGHWTCAWVHAVWYERRIGSCSWASSSWASGAASPVALESHRPLPIDDADLVLVGHDHNYQRYGKMDSYQIATTDGLRQVIAGTGAAGFSGDGGPATKAPKEPNAFPSVPMSTGTSS